MCGALYYAKLPMMQCEFEVLKVSSLHDSEVLKVSLLHGALYAKCLRVCKVFLGSRALYTKCPDYAKFYMQSVLIKQGFSMQSVLII